MCKQIDTSLINAINKDELYNKSRRSHLKLLRLFKNLNQELCYNNDNSESSEVGSVLLEEFPCANRNDHKSIFSVFQNKDRSFSRRRRRMNVDEPRDAMDATIRDGLRNMHLDSNTSQSINVCNRRVKHASIDAEQLEELRNCTRICLSASHDKVRKNAADIEQLVNRNRVYASMHSMKNEQSNSLYSFNSV